MSPRWEPPPLSTDPDPATLEAAEERAAIMEVDGDLTPLEACEKATFKDNAAAVPHPAGEELVVNNRFLNKWCESIARATDADRTLVLFAGVGLLSALCHNFYFYAPRATYLNLFLFILGPSSTPRKTTVLDMVRDYLVDVKVDLILPDEFTQEGLILALADQNHGIVISRELHSWLETMLTKDYNKGLASSLGNIYDHMTCFSRRTVKGGKVIINDPVLSILGAGVDDYLITILKKIDMISGFWPRVALVQLPHPATRISRPPGEFHIEPHILEKLKTLASQEGRELRYKAISPLREAYAKQIYEEAVALDNSNLVAGYARLEWILVKIAALLQLADDPASKEIGPEAFYDAKTLTDYIKRGLPFFYGEHLKPNEEIELAAKLFAYIKKHDENGTTWVPYRDILQNAHADTGKVQTALKRLLATDQCEQTDIPPTKQGGRPGAAYRRMVC